MNGPPDPSIWEEPAMRAALGARDVTRVYRLLQLRGYAQQRIGALTGQSQPEVSAIIHGRKVMAYDVLSKAADGLGIPRGHMGLAYAEASVRVADGTTAAAEPGDTTEDGPPSGAVAEPIAPASGQSSACVPVALIGAIPPAA